MQSALGSNSAGVRGRLRSSLVLTDVWKPLDTHHHHHSQLSHLVSRLQVPVVYTTRASHDSLHLAAMSNTARGCQHGSKGVTSNRRGRSSQKNSPESRNEQKGSDATAACGRRNIREGSTDCRAPWIVKAVLEHRSRATRDSCAPAVTTVTPATTTVTPATTTVTPATTTVTPAVTTVTPAITTVTPAVTTVAGGAVVVVVTITNTTAHMTRCHKFLPLLMFRLVLSLRLIISRDSFSVLGRLHELQLVPACALC
ncbi:hypothetical protein FHG87_005352 [Trinorchestia longiramus]|nr:hypothetical protein FHG87_005352 [Trinorchestia longiramus]